MQSCLTLQRSRQAKRKKERGRLEVKRLLVQITLSAWWYMKQGMMLGVELW